MDKYRFSDIETKLMESSRIPFALYQFIDNSIYTIVVSDAMCELFGFDDREEAIRVLDNDMYRDTYPEDVSRVTEAAIRFATEGGEYNVVYRSRSPREGEEYMIVHAFGKHIYTDTGVRLAVVWYCDEGTDHVNDFDKQDSFNGYIDTCLREQPAFHDNFYDGLTGLPNMNHFFKLADTGRKRIQAKGEKTAFLFFDLSGMKGFNRKYGFSEGDKLIRAVARLLVKYFPSNSCSRFGQDHFAVYTSAKGVEERLNIILEESKRINGGKTLPIRAGIYIDKDDEEDIAIACDRAKAASDLNRMTYFPVYEYFDETLKDITASRSYILDNLDRALEERWIKVYYHPIIRSASGKVCDEEALARWDDPERGLLPPSEFIPVLEDSKLIYKLDLYMLERVLEEFRVREDNGLEPVPVSINLSRSDFDVLDMPEEICKRVDASGIPRAKINIELTESVIGRDYDYMSKQVDRFHEMGFNVWMDDFGSGYSALDVLQRFDFDVIKFDMKFVKEYDRSTKSRIILTELMQMVVKLGIDTVAEGVETLDHVSFLKEIGCDMVQGYFFSRPEPLKNIIDVYSIGQGIGLEDPLEKDYYTTVGMTNLNDPGVIKKTDLENYDHYFGTIPMGILEIDNGESRVLRCNKAYEDFLVRVFDKTIPEKEFTGELDTDYSLDTFMAAVEKCIRTGDWASVNETFPDGSSVSSFVRRIAYNKQNGASALLVVVLALMAD